MGSHSLEQSDGGALRNVDDTPQRQNDVRLSKFTPVSACAQLSERGELTQSPARPKNRNSPLSTIESPTSFLPSRYETIPVGCFQTRVVTVVRRST